VDVVFGEDENDDESQDKKKLSGACNLVFKYSNELANTHDILSAWRFCKRASSTQKSYRPLILIFCSRQWGSCCRTRRPRKTRREILIEGERIVGNLSRSRTGATPQMEDVPFDAPPMKVARLW
jgi:hypothetical protein